MAVEEGEVGGGLLSNLTPRQRLVAMGSFVAIVVLFISLIVLLMGQKGEDKLVVIVKDLPPKSVGEAVERLKEKKIVYEIRDEGRSIAVEKNQKDQAIIDLSMANLPHDGRVGFEIFGDKAGGFISTDFEKKVALQRAMNGELSRIIQKMNGVDNATVMIVVPEPQLFQEQQLPTTASVLVKLSGSGGFTTEQVETITHLIASSVPGLKPQNVTISDTEGHMLAAGQGSGESESGKFNKELSKQLEIKKEIETKLQGKVIESLEKIVGPGHVVAKIEAKVNFDAEQRRIRNMTPVIDPKTNEPLPVAVKSLRERNTEPKYPEGGGSGSIPGISSNTGTTTTAVAGAAGTTTTGTTTTTSAASAPGAIMAVNDKDTDQKTMNFNNEEKLVTPAIGSIERITASVTYQYGTPKAAGAGEEVAAEGEGTGPKKLTEDDVAKIVKDTIGFVENRDSLTVKEVVFDDTNQKLLEEQMKRMDAAKKQIAWWWALVAGLIALVVGAGIGGALLGKKVPPPEAGAGAFGGAPGGDYAAIPGAPPGGAIPAPGGGPEVAAPQDKVEVSRSPVTPPPDNPFGFLYGVEAETVANLLSSERLPTLVAVLAQLDPSQADDVITLLNPEIQSEVRSRLANNPVLPPMTQKMVSQSLKKRLQSLSVAA